MSNTDENGHLLTGYGDAQDNTGPVDVVAFNPDNGAYTIHLPAQDTEAMSFYRTFSDGSKWAVSLDPRQSDVGFLVTNRGGDWHRITVDIPGLTVAVHLHDIAEAGNTILVCGSRDILPGERDTRPDDEGAAMVWASTDGGNTWVEELVFFGHQLTEYNRFYAFARLDGKLFVNTSDDAAPPEERGYWTRDNGTWSTIYLDPNAMFIRGDFFSGPGDNFYFGGTPASKFTLDQSGLIVRELISDTALIALAVKGDRMIYREQGPGNGIQDTGHGFCGNPPNGELVSSAVIADDYRLYVATTNAKIYRLDFANTDTSD